jgi:hypothetical protein
MTPVLIAPMVCQVFRTVFRTVEYELAIMVLLPRVGKSTLRAIAENSAKLLKFQIIGHINLAT